MSKLLDGLSTYLRTGNDSVLHEEKYTDTFIRDLLIDVALPITSTRIVYADDYSDFSHHVFKSSEPITQEDFDWIRNSTLSNLMVLSPTGLVDYPVTSYSSLDVYLEDFDLLSDKTSFDKVITREDINDFNPILDRLRQINGVDSADVIYAPADNSMIVKLNVYRNDQFVNYLTRVTADSNIKIVSSPNRFNFVFTPSKQVLSELVYEILHHSTHTFEDDSTENLMSFLINFMICQPNIVQVSYNNVTRKISFYYITRYGSLDSIETGPFTGYLKISNMYDCRPVVDTKKDSVV